MADAETKGANNLQTDDVTNHADGDNQLKSPVTNNDPPSVNINNSKDTKPTDLKEAAEGDEVDGKAVKDDKVEGGKKRTVDDCSVKDKRDGVKDGQGDEMEQGEEDEESGEEDEEGSDEEGETDEEGMEGEEETDDEEDGEDEDEEDGEDVEGDEEDDIETGDAEADEESSMEDETDDPDVDKCPVCLCPFSDQDVGTPESCDHTFCLECILEWSKNVNTCPVDRSIFRAVLVRHAVGGEVVKHLDVDEPKAEFDGGNDEDPTYCEVCGRCDREDRLLLCDGCDAGYHCECLTPPLEHIPVEEWFCPECVARNRHHDTTEVEAGDEDENEWTTIEQRPNVVRIIARTGVSERVRAVITRARAQRQIEEDAARPSTSRRPRAGTPRRKKTTKRKTTKRRRTTSKSPRKRKGKVKKRRKKKGVKRRKGTKKRKTIMGARTVKRTPTTVRGRIAKSLLLVKPRSGSIMPDQKVPVAKKNSMDYRLGELGHTKLSITGSNALFEPSADGGYTDSPKAAVPTTSRSEPVISSGGISDLLGSIMVGQNLLHTKTSDVKIHRDGKLSYNKNKDDTSKSSPKKQKSELKNDLAEEDKKSNPGSDDEAAPGCTLENSNPDDHNTAKPPVPVDKEGGSKEKGGNKEGCDEDEEEGNWSPMEHDGGEESDEDEGAEEEKLPSNKQDNPKQDPTQADNPGVEDKDMESKTDDTSIERPVDKKQDIANKDNAVKDDNMELKDVSLDKNDHEDGEVKCDDDNKELGTHWGNVLSDKNLTKENLESNPEDDQDKDKSKDLSQDLSVNKEDKKDNMNEQGEANVCNENNSIPADSKNSTEAGEVEILNSKELGEIEILKVNIINKPKRKDKKGDKKRHDSSSGWDSQSEEEGVILDIRPVVKVKEKKKKKKDSKRRSKDIDHKGKKMGDSTAEEGEVKSDDDGSGRKKKKQKKKKKNKDKRNVVLDSTSPKPLIPELSKSQKGKDGKKSDSDMSKSKERGNYGDLRQVIQVKRDSHTDDDVVRRYEAYWNEFGKRRGDERRVEGASQWEQLYSYGAFGFEEGKQWENFTVQRDRSPIYDRRKNTDIVERKRVDARRNSRGDRNVGQGRDMQFRPEKETMAERAVRLEREAAKRERQQQELARRGGREQLTMAEIEARQLMRTRMDAHIERKYGKQGWTGKAKGKQHNPHSQHDDRVSATDKHGREQEYDQHSESSKGKSRDRDRLKQKDLKHNDHSRERKRQRRSEASRSSRSRDEYSSDRHRSRDRRSYDDSDMSRSSSRSMSAPSDKEPEPHKALPKTSTVPTQSHLLHGPPEVTKKKKKDKAKGKKDKKTKEAKKAAKKAKGAKAGKKNKTGAAAEKPAVAAQVEQQPSAAKKPQEEAQAAEQPPAKKQKKIKGKKDKKAKKKAAKLAAKAGKASVARPTCMLQDDEDPDVIDLTGEIVESGSPTPSTPPTPKPATPTKPPPKDPSPIVSSTADIRDANNPSSLLYDPFEPTASPPVSYSNSPSPISSDGGLQTRKSPSSSMPRVSRGSGDREIESLSSKRPYSPRDPPRGRRSPQGSPPQATSSSAASIAKLLPALTHNSQINQLLGSITNNPALQSVLSASAGSAHGTSLTGSPSCSESSYTKMSGSLRIASPPVQRRRPIREVDTPEDDIESSAVDLYNKNSRERYLRKLHHQERVVEEVKLAIKPFYQRRDINKDEYKEILKKSVNQVCHSKSGEINPVKIRNLIEGYVKKALTKRKLGSGSNMKPLIITSTKSRKLTKLVL